MPFFDWSLNNCSFSSCKYEDYHEALEKAATDYYISYLQAYLSNNLYVWGAAYKNTFVEMHYNILNEMSEKNPGFEFLMDSWLNEN